MNIEQMLLDIKGRSLTWKDVAERLGYNQSTVYDWFKRRRKASYKAYSDVMHLWLSKQVKQAKQNRRLERNQDYGKG